MPDNKNTQALEPLQQTIRSVSETAQSIFQRNDKPIVVVSPYRMNPLGAHIDHQGGSVLARTINQYTVLALFPSNSSNVVLHSVKGAEQAGISAVGKLESVNNTSFELGSPATGENWERYAKASANCFQSILPAAKGFDAVVFGTLVGAGLSSSASVILAYLLGLAGANNMQLKETELVELSRQVENEHMGLNNGLQDQMSVVFGRESGMSLLDMQSVSARYFDNPPNSEEVSWVVCYSGYSRELVSSGFNDRVRECREAATMLDPSASHLGEVAEHLRDQKNIRSLPDHLQLRALHVYTEMQRVEEGSYAWSAGDWQRFGDLMNQSCNSSIHQYQCGSEPMIALHNIALEQKAVLGSRFGGGGYGGCLMMLTDSAHKGTVQNAVLTAYLKQFPEMQGIAKTFIAHAEKNVRIMSVGT